MREQKITRRKFLGLMAGSAALAGGVMVGCAEAPAPTDAPEEAELKEAPTVISGAKETITLGFWAGTWLEEVVRPTVLTPFEEENNCEVVVESGWPFFPKFVSAPKDKPPMDVFNNNLGEAFKLTDADFVEDPESYKGQLTNAPDQWDFTWNKAGVTHGWSPYGIGYRSDLVDPAPTRYEDMWDDKFADKRGTYVISNTLGQVFFMAVSEIFGTGLTDIEGGFEAMRAFLPCKLADFTTQMTGLLERGEIEVANIHDADIFQQADTGLPFDFAFVEDGRTGVLCQNLSVSKHSEHKELAIKLVDAFLEPENNAKVLAPFYMRPGNSKTKVLGGAAERGVKNTSDEIEGLWVPDWSWWNENEDEIAEGYNEIMAGIEVEGSS